MVDIVFFAWASFELITTSSIGGYTGICEYASICVEGRCCVSCVAVQWYRRETFPW